MLKNEVTALQFSGGKDSLACLFLMQPHWDELTVYWTNTGAALPETAELIEQVRATVPHFVEIRTDQPSDLVDNGWPVDVLPVRSALPMREMYGKPRLRLQSFFDCCYRNIMGPMHERMIADGVKVIIRGQRNQETHKSMLRSGDVVDGFKVLFPIEGWTGEQVRAYLADKPIKLPSNYEDMDTSLDCWNCTAWLEDNIGKRRYLKRVHPEAYTVVREMLTLIEAEIDRDRAYLLEAIAV